MYCGQDMPTASPSDDANYTIDFINDVQEGQTVISAAPYLTVISGVDATAGNHLIGGSTIDGKFVIQRIRSLNAGVIYAYGAVVVDSTGAQIDLYTRIPCQDVL